MKRRKHPKLRKIGHGAAKVGHHAVHLIYCGAVFVEGHGLYAWAAGGLGVFVLSDACAELVKHYLSGDGATDDQADPEKTETDL